MFKKLMTMGNSMNRVLVIALMIVCVATGMKAESEVPILGIAHAAFQVSSLERSRAYYTAFYGFEFAFAVNEDSEAWYLKINDDQFLKLVGTPEGTDDNRLEEVAFQVSDMETTMAFLRDRGLDPKPVKKRADGTLATELIDPDGHRLVFVEYAVDSMQMLARGKHLGARRVCERLWHVGLTISNESAANALYRDALGFRETWRGSRKDDGPDAWVNMQMPGRRGDYIEYILLNGNQPDRQQLGTMHHVCYLTGDIRKAHRDMLFNALPDLEQYEPTVGRNNRWLFNVHDIDGTRSELMEDRKAVTEQ